MLWVDCDVAIVTECEPLISTIVWSQAFVSLYMWDAEGEKVVVFPTLKLPQLNFLF